MSFVIIIELVSSGELICAIMQNFIKIGRTVLEITHFLIFEMAAVRHLGFSNFQTIGHHPSGWGG